MTWWKNPNKGKKPSNNHKEPEILEAKVYEIDAYKGLFELEMMDGSTVEIILHFGDEDEIEVAFDDEDNGDTEE